MEQVQTPAVTTNDRRKPRQSADVRWGQALSRGIAAGIDVQAIEGVGWFVESTKHNGSGYLVTRAGSGFSCTCPAGVAGDVVCVHRASVKCCLGELAPPRPEPTGKCMECNGGGVIWEPEVAKYGGWHPSCQTCRGTGQAEPNRLAA